MIHFFVGTKAQLIKTAPVMIALDRRGHRYRYIDSGQHAAFTSGLRRSFGLREPDTSLCTRSSDVTTFREAIKWTSGFFVSIAARPNWIRNEVFNNQSGICVVHGDTVSTLLGALFAKRAGLQVAHLEAGLRSYRYFQPFPEELIRVWCMRLSTVLFAPDQTALANLAQMRVKGTAVLTHGNTVLDALRLQESSCGPFNRTQDSYVLATCHRLEALRSRRCLAAMVRCVNAVAESYPVVFVLHKPTEAALRRGDLLQALDKNVERLPMQEYPEFISLLRNARFVMADGGSIQEECAALRVPLLVLRSHTERADGIGVTAELIGFDENRVRQYAANPPVKQHAPPCLGSRSPSEIVAEYLIEWDSANSDDTPIVK
jgi:UDP-N-acetylglucosamine 2-epimerase (non-hydrolysing)